MPDTETTIAPTPSATRKRAPRVTVPAAPTVGLLNATDTLLRQEIEALDPSIKTAQAQRGTFVFARAISWGTLVQLGSDQNVVAAAWGVSKSQASHPMNGCVSGQFLTRIGVTYVFAKMGAEAKAELESLGIRTISDYAVTFSQKGKPVPAAFWKNYREITKRDTEAGKTDALIKSWLESAKSMEALEAVYAAWLKASQAASKEVPNQKAALSALALVQGKPSAELVAELKRVLAIK